MHCRTSGELLAPVTHKRENEPAKAISEPTFEGFVKRIAAISKAEVDVIEAAEREQFSVKNKRKPKRAVG